MCSLCSHADSWSRLAFFAGFATVSLCIVHCLPWTHSAQARSTACLTKKLAKFQAVRSARTRSTRVRMASTRAKRVDDLGMEQRSAVKCMFILRSQSKLHLPKSFQRGSRRLPRRVPWLQKQARPKVQAVQPLRCLSQRLPKVRQYTCLASD